MAWAQCRRSLTPSVLIWYCTGMYLKITRSGPRTYLQIMEAYRDPETGRPKKRYIGSVGWLDQLERKDLDSLIDGLLKVTNRPTLAELQEVSADGVG